MRIASHPSGLASSGRHDVDIFVYTFFSVYPFSKHKDKFDIYIYNENVKCWVNEHGRVNCGLDFDKVISSSSQYNQDGETNEKR